MVSGEVSIGSQSHTQTATFDVYGNLTQLVSGSDSQSVPVNAATNRITLSGSTYDEGGNLTRLAVGGEVFAYEYDGAGAMKHLQSNTDLARIFIYNADDERIAVFDRVNRDCTPQGSSETWTIRGSSPAFSRRRVRPDTIRGSPSRSTSCTGPAAMRGSAGRRAPRRSRRPRGLPAGREGRLCCRPAWRPAP